MGIKEILDTVIKENGALVNSWLNNEKGAWGALAGKAVVAVSRHLGRSLTEEEKRAVWQTMWDKLMAIREG